MATTRRATVTISEFSFEWILFSDLSGLSNVRNKLHRFDCVKDRFGVYIFFDTSGSVPYVGLCGENPCQKKYMYHRIAQHFVNNPSTGSSFYNNWKTKQGEARLITYKDFIANCQLGTLSIHITDLNCNQRNKLIKTIGDIESALICKYKPAYNKPFLHGLTDNERNHLERFVAQHVTSSNRLPNTSPPANPSDGNTIPPRDTRTMRTKTNGK